MALSFMVVARNLSSIVGMREGADGKECGGSLMK